MKSNKHSSLCEDLKAECRLKNSSSCKALLWPDIRRDSLSDQESLHLDFNDRLHKDVLTLNSTFKVSHLKVAGSSGSKQYIGLQKSTHSFILKTASLHMLSM